ncbi:helix-turn-helix domain-containing protein, partial [Klebsiella pneumoniae]|uniref:helix-turn-helix domain-containing protein n=1 Tax=Klebsiella pneumoniae TaxID=573 RepID=UPI003B5A8E5B
AREKLEELHGLFLGKETVRRIMVRAGLWVPRKQRAARIPQPRYRRPCTGELVDRRLTTQMAAQRLGIPDRQCRRLLSRYNQSGPLSMP